MVDSDYFNVGRIGFCGKQTKDILRVTTIRIQGPISFTKNGWEIIQSSWNVVI